MGDYTGIRCEIKFKPAFVPASERLIQGEISWADLGFDAADQMNRLKRGQELAQQGVWIFQTGMKDYDGEIDWFIQQIVPVIAEQTYWLELFRAYEPYTHSTLYTYRKEQWSTSAGEGYRWHG